MKKFKKPDPRRVQGRPQPQNSAPKGRCVVGIHAVAELLKVRPKAIEQFWMREKYADHPELTALHDQAKGRGVRVQLHNPAVLDRVIASHQGVMAFTQDEPELDFQALEAAEEATLIALDEVEDPHNLGAILRTAWLLGVQGVLTPEHRSAHLSPAVSKVAQGAAEHVPVVRETALPERLKRLKEHGFWILGMSHKAKQDLFRLDIPKKVVWVLGSESSGLRKSVEGACDDLISIPQGVAEASYNVSVAAALALGETFRQRRQP
jgi:23S rRNA (guanosine2251-2'-O)-methyltransferase